MGEAHGHARRGARTPEHAAWIQMRARCNNPRRAGYKNYGGRGIRVCSRWESFEAFLVDVGPRPSANHSLDRHPDNDGDYEPGNVRWATRVEQARNRRNAVRLTHQGRTLALVDWATELGLSPYTLYHRHRSGLPVERVLEVGRRPGQRRSLDR